MTQIQNVSEPSLPTTALRRVMIHHILSGIVLVGLGMASIEYVERHAWPDVNHQLVAMLGAIFILMTFSAAHAFLFTNTLRHRNLQEQFSSTLARTTKFTLLSGALTAGTLCLILGGANWIRPVPLPTLPVLLKVLIVFLGVAFPLDAGGMIPKRTAVIGLSAAIGMGFTILFPVYMFGRPGGTRRDGYIAVLAILMVLTGWGFWVVGANAIHYKF